MKITVEIQKENTQLVYIDFRLDQKLLYWWDDEQGRFMRRTQTILDFDF